jgi:hypothetical protein
VQVERRESFTSVLGYVMALTLNSTSNFCVCFIRSLDPRIDSSLPVAVGLGWARETEKNCSHGHGQQPRANLRPCSLPLHVAASTCLYQFSTYLLFGVPTPNSVLLFGVASTSQTHKQPPNRKWTLLGQKLSQNKLRIHQFCINITASTFISQ